MRGNMLQENIKCTELRVSDIMSVKCFIRGNLFVFVKNYTTDDVNICVINK